MRIRFTGNIYATYTYTTTNIEVTQVSSIRALGK
jgi:hypothetical protein